MSHDETHADLVLTLIADPATRPLGEADVAAAARALEGTGAQPDSPRWLAPHTACDLGFSAENPSPLAAEAVRAALGELPIDVAVLPASDRRKRALVADMDSTIVTSETLDEMAEAVGLKDSIAAITARAMNGELDFEEALDERVGMLAGLPESAVAATLARVALTPGARTLVQTMKAHGAATALVSGGFTAIAEPVAEQCGFDRVVANRLVLADGKLTGQVVKPVVDKHSKLATLSEMAQEVSCGRAAICAVGDGANDLPMLLAAGLGVAFRAKPAVRAEAPICLEHTDLCSLLYLQGYRREEFVT